MKLKQCPFSLSLTPMQCQTAPLIPPTTTPLLTYKGSPPSNYTYITPTGSSRHLEEEGEKTEQAGHGDTVRDSGTGEASRGRRGRGRAAAAGVSSVAAAG